MSISSVGSFQPQNSPTAHLTKDLENNGLGEKAAETVSSQIDSIVGSALSDGGTPDKTKIKDAINQQLKTDVANGTLTQDQANAVSATLDKLDQQKPTGTPPAGVQAPGGVQSGQEGGSSKGGGAKGGASGSSSSNKTEVSRSTVKEGSQKVTTITYSDKSKETKTSYDFTSSDTTDSKSSTLNNLKDLINSNSNLSSDDKAKTINYLNNLALNGVIKTTA